jgi:hypothetical protein
LLGGADAGELEQTLIQGGIAVDAEGARRLHEALGGFA